MPATRRQILSALPVLALPVLALPVLARRSRAQGRPQFTAMATGLEEPWALDFLPDGRFLVTERPGRLRLFAPDGGAGQEVVGLPEVVRGGQAGLLDLRVARDFATTRRLWLTYSEASPGGASTALGVARLSDDGPMIEGFRRLHHGLGTPGGRHFGSRAVEAPDGTLFLTTGDRGQGPLAQDVTRPEGKVLAFAPDGSPMTAPAFAGQAVVPGLWTLGHRNIQGAALDGQGRLWTVEHGAKGGDELNRIEAGRNYGWPVITYGVNYNGKPIGEGTARDGMQQPVHYWDPSIAPSGLMFHSGRMFADWRGHVLTGSLNSDLIARLDPRQGHAETRIATPETSRVRDVREGPDGAVWVLSVGNGAVFRMTPG